MTPHPMTRHPSPGHPSPGRPRQRRPPGPKAVDGPSSPLFGGRWPIDPLDLGGAPPITARSPAVIRPARRERCPCPMITKEKFPLRTLFFRDHETLAHPMLITARCGRHAAIVGTCAASGAPNYPRSPPAPGRPPDNSKMRLRRVDGGSLGALSGPWRSTILQAAIVCG
jgi:hypothetical protein